MAIVALGLALLPLVGCGTKRSITVTSEPANALVFLNDEEIGRTPVTVPFTFYGVYDLRLEADGYKAVLTQREAKAPLWEYPGPDLVGEAVGGESHIQWHVDMEPLPVGDEASLVDRARQMRALLKSEIPDTQPATQPDTAPAK